MYSGDVVHFVETKFDNWLSDWSNDYQIGSVFLSQRLTGEVHLKFLEEKLSEFLDDVPLAIKILIWLMHNGAQSDFSIVARDFLIVKCYIFHLVSSKKMGLKKSLLNKVFLE